MVINNNIIVTISYFGIKNLFTQIFSVLMNFSNHVPFNLWNSMKKFHIAKMFVINYFHYSYKSEICIQYNTMLKYDLNCYLAFQFLTKKYSLFIINEHFSKIFKTWCARNIFLAYQIIKIFDKYGSTIFQSGIKYLVVCMKH